VFSTTADGASSPTERVRIDSSGKVGINTDNPGSKLHVKGTKDATTGSINPSTFDVTFESGTAGLGYAQVDGYPALQGFGTGTGYHMSLNPREGNVGIRKTNPATELDVNGTVRATTFDLDALDPLP